MKKESQTSPGPVRKRTGLRYIMESLRISPEEKRPLRVLLEKLFGLEISEAVLLRRSIDARQKKVVFSLKLLITVSPATPPSLLRKLEKRGIIARYEEPEHEEIKRTLSLPAPEPLIIGAGPAGLFLALELARLGYRPVVAERGERVEERKIKVEKLWNEGLLDPDSNVHFGEGGAGTFSDGKLTLLKKQPGYTDIMKELIKFGAPEEILVDAFPHIGTDLLLEILKNLRKELEKSGVTFLFSRRLVDIECKNCYITSVILQNTVTGHRERLETPCLMLAPGNSAREIFQLLHQKNVAMRFKPFAVGMRIEHPSEFITESLYGPHYSKILGNASYRLKARISPANPADFSDNSFETENLRKDSHITELNTAGSSPSSVYTFCMCPGGEVILSATEEGRLVTNGMSYHARAGKFSNSAILAPVTEDLVRKILFETLSASSAKKFQYSIIRELQDSNEERKNNQELIKSFLYSPLVGVEFQRILEEAAFRAGGGGFVAPVQLAGDFVAGRTTLHKPSVSYRRGVSPARLDRILPEPITEAIKEGLLQFEKKIKGFIDEGVFTGVETRSSSPLTLERDIFWRSLSHENLYLFGEGAGYAGGIMTSILDSVKFARHLLPAGKKSV